MSLFRTFFASASTLTIAACATVGPDYAAPDATPFTSHSLESDPAIAVSKTEPAQQWWLALNDGILNQLIETAFIENRDLRVAAANVEAARASLTREQTNLRPTGEASADYQRRQLSGASFGADGVSFDDTDYFDVGIGASWELDFFGRVRRANEAARADAESANYTLKDAQALIASETARAYVDYRGAQIQIAVAVENLNNQTETKELTQLRFEEGLGSRLDVARAESQAKFTESSIPPLEAKQVAAANRLATLTGAPVAKIENMLASASATLPTSPSALAIGDAEGLLKRRADVRAAERNLAAATARIGVAKADYFPRVTLIGSVSASAQTLSGVGGDGSLGFGVGPSLAWSGFDIPKVRAGVRAADARADAAFAAYEQTVLTALEETQTALADFGRERVRVGALTDAAASARESAELARERYDAGADDFIDVLVAENQLLAADASLAESQTALTAKYINVHLALGVGWAS